MVENRSQNVRTVYSHYILFFYIRMQLFVLLFGSTTGRHGNERSSRSMKGSRHWRRRTRWVGSSTLGPTQSHLHHLLLLPTTPMMRLTKRRKWVSHDLFSTFIPSLNTRAIADSRLSVLEIPKFFLRVYQQSPYFFTSVHLPQRLVPVF